MPEARLRTGIVRYREQGSGPPIVFVGGILVNGDLWRNVVPPLAREHRCIVPDWPLGSHTLPFAAHADLSPPGLAAVVAELLDVLDLHDVTLVGNDTGGAICQMVAAWHPERVGRLVLTPCDAFENFLPPIFRPLQVLARVPGGMWLVLQTLRARPIRRLPMAFGWLARRAPEREVQDGYLRPATTTPGVRRDLAKVLRGISTKHTLDAAEALPHFNRPALIAWAREDRFFPVEHGRRLAALLPDSRLELIEDSYTFVPEDQPARLAALIGEFSR